MADTPNRNQPSPEDKPQAPPKPKAATATKEKKPKARATPVVVTPQKDDWYDGKTAANMDRTTYRVSHKKWAFILVMTVVGFQMSLIAGVFIGCFIDYPKILDRDPSNERCSGNQATEMLLSLAAQSFALYAAEK